MRISRLRVLLAALLAGAYGSVWCKSHRATPASESKAPVAAAVHRAGEALCQDSELDEEGGRDWREIERRLLDGSLQPTDYFSFVDKHVKVKTESLVDQLVPKVSPSSSHIVTVTDCTLLHDWQSLLLFYSASLGTTRQFYPNCCELQREGAI